MIASILAKTGTYSENDKKLFEKRIVYRKIQKDEILLGEGEVCQSAYYLISGAFYQHNFKNEIDLNVIDLHIDNEWFLNQQSFIKQKPSEITLQAYTESEIFELSIVSIHVLIQESPAFFQFGKILEQPYNRVHFFDNNLTPTQKYQYILDNKPALLQNFPLKIIASYLKITPETLSRVRESFAKGKIIS